MNLGSMSYPHHIVRVSHADDHALLVFRRLTMGIAAVLRVTSVSLSSGTIMILVTEPRFELA